MNEVINSSNKLMKTSKDMIRNMGGYEIIQRTKDGYFDANHLLQQWNKTPGNPKRQMAEFLESPKTKEFIKQIENEEGEHIRKTGSGDNQIVIKVKGRNSKNGRTPDRVYHHPYLFIDFAMWLSPAFKYKVIEFVYDNLIGNRHEAGDQFKTLNRAAYSLKHNGKRLGPDEFSRIARALNHLVFGTHKGDLRQTATEQQLKALANLQEKLAFIVTLGYVTDFNGLMDAMRKEWNNQQGGIN